LALADPTARLKTASRAAGRRRVRAGMTVTEALAHCAELDVQPWDDVVISRAIIDTTAALLAASPQVTPVSGAPGVWWVGANGLDHVGGERALLASVARIAGQWHPDVRVAIADSCVAARAATWGDKPRCIIPTGGDAAYLATAPLTLIPIDEDVREALLALGLRTVGSLAALTAAQVERRWGEAGLVAWRLAHGDDRRRPARARPEAQRAVTVELPASVTTLEPVLFLVRAALDRLTPQLVAEARAAAIVAITLLLDDNRTVTREARMARPLARVVPLFERCRGLLERFTLSAPVLGVTVAITATAPTTGEQGNLFDTGWRDPSGLDAAIDRLRAELGPNTVVYPVARDRHRPERSGAWVEHDAEIPGPRAASGVAERPRRFLESPETVEVECTGDHPIAFRWRARRIAIARAIGPERLAGDWWDDAYCRDYWRCSSPSATFILYVDYTRGAQWYVQGWED
jgi:nucleotidyltransferase/DNA polymerase involved in DNA repair